MLKYRGGEKAGKGTYWNLHDGQRVDISGEGILPGDKRTAFYRMPATAIIVVAPVLGLVYAAFLPFIGIAMLVKLLAQKIGGGVLETIQGSASFGWRPSESYLSGRKNMVRKVEAPKERDDKAGS